MNYDTDQLSEASAKMREDRDCAVRAVTAATDYSYEDVHWVFELFGRKRRKGTPVSITVKVLEKLGYKPVDVTGVYRRRGAKTIRTLQRVINRNNTYLVRVRGHILCIRGGKVLDWADNRCHRIIEIWRIEECS